MISLTSPVETAAHRWPAGLKLGLLCLATITLFAVETVALQLVFLAVTAVLYLLPGLTFAKAGARRLWGLWPFVVLILLWHVLSGDASGGLLIVCRMLTAVGVATLVTMTTQLSHMMQVVRWLLAPLARAGVPVERVELAMALVIRFTPVLADKGKMLSMAWRARSSRRPGWRILIPFAVIAIDDAEHVGEALRARGGL